MKMLSKTAYISYDLHFKVKKKKKFEISHLVNHEGKLVSWCCQSGQPQRIISGPETNINPSTAYSKQMS